MFCDIKEDNHFVAGNVYMRVKVYSSNVFDCTGESHTTTNICERIFLRKPICSILPIDLIWCAWHQCYAMLWRMRWEGRELHSSMRNVISPLIIQCLCVIALLALWLNSIFAYKFPRIIRMQKSVLLLS